MSDNEKFKRLFDALAPAIKTLNEDVGLTPDQWYNFGVQIKVGKDGSIHMTGASLDETPQASSPPAGSH